MKTKPQYTGISTRAAQMLRFIVDYKITHDGNSPNMREIGAAAGVESSSLISFYLGELERRGFIRRSRSYARQIELVGGTYTYQEGRQQP